MLGKDFALKQIVFNFRYFSEQIVSSCYNKIKSMPNEESKGGYNSDVNDTDTILEGMQQQDLQDQKEDERFPGSYDYGQGFDDVEFPSYQNGPWQTDANGYRRYEGNNPNGMRMVLLGRETRVVNVDRTRTLEVRRATVTRGGET